MKLIKNGRTLALTALIILMAVLVTPALGAPDQQQNLLQNPGFEEGTYTQASNIEAPTGWSAWYISQDGGSTPERCTLWEQPRFQLNGGSGVPHSGSYAANYYTLWASHNAGYYQKVSGVSAGKIYRFSIYGYTISRQEDDDSSTSGTGMWVGIDPTGGTDATSGNIIWSGNYNIQNSHGQLQIEAEAKGDSITVFTRTQPVWCLDHNDAFWDDASLTEVGDAPASSDNNDNNNQSSGNNQPSGDYVIATPDANGRIVHTVQSGDTLSAIAYTYGVSIQQIKDLNGLTNNIAVLGVRLVIKSGDETPEPAATEEPAEEEADSGDQPAEDSGDEVAESGEEAPPEEESGAATASVCVTSYADVNANGIRDTEEEKVANISFVLNDGSETVGTYTSTDADEFFCFEGLTPGQYVVTWTGENYTPTTEQTWTVNVSEGAILQREFGMQASGSAPAGEEPVEADTSIGGEKGGLPNWLTALIGAVAVIVFLSGIGAGIYFFLIRRQQKV